MADFRKETPARRENAPRFKNNHDYKLLLRDDFHHRCGYCGDHEFFRETYYEIDHFVPHTLDKNRLCDYYNLVYSCRACNNSKNDKWPTGDAATPNDGKSGWIDPCSPEYAKQFERLEDGSIMSKTDLGQWMWSALTLGNPIHRIKWKMEQLRTLLKETDDFKDIRDIDKLHKILALNTYYRQLEEELRGKADF